MATYFCVLDFYVEIVLVCFGINIVLANNQCPSLCVCLGDRVDCESLGLDYVPDDLPSWTKNLYLADNNIKSLVSNSLQGLESLEEIDLSKNAIERIGEDVFSGLPNLKKITLSSNSLEELPYLAENSPVTELDISHNRIRWVSETPLRNARQLRHLDLSYNRLTDLTVKFPAMPNLNELWLNNNRITSIGNGTFDNLTNLEYLRLTKNQISTLAKETFTRLTNLKHLELNKNKITHIDGLTFNSLSKLETLKLKRNNITQLKDGCFYGLEKIQELELDNNNISLVNKSWLYGLNSLKKLSMPFNHVREIEADAWEYCPSLQELDLSNNALTHMDKQAFSHLTKLELLWLNDNKIAHIAESTFEDMSSLSILDLNNNQISWSIEDRGGAFEGLQSLTELRLENNGIQSLNQDAFLGLTKLKVLLMQQNNISTVHPLAFQELTQMEEFNFNTSTLLCDCDLSWLPGWLEERQFKATVQGRCSHPPELRGKSLYNVSKGQFQCVRSDHPEPFMVTEPENMIARRGQTIKLHCSAASSVQSPMTVHWRKDNFPIEGSQINTSASMMDEVIVMTSELVITDAVDEHSGVYQCMAVNEVGKTYSKKARINVLVFPKFTKKPKDVTVKSSEFATTATLECAATGQPDPEISWQKDGGEDFPAARERRMHVRANDEFLISNVKLEDQGVYTCTATNEAGTIMTNATLTVLEHPKFAETMTDQTAYAGETAVLECMAQGSPQPAVVWLKDDEELKMTERHFFTAENQLLVIVEAKPSDSGKYTCRMTNPLGMISDSMQLHISGGQESVGIFSDNTTTTGIIIIAVVCCVVGTSLIWVVIIYQTRRKNEEYSSTPTEETTVPEVAYQSVDKNGKTTTHYAPRMANGPAYMNGGPRYANGILPGSHTRQIALADGVQVTYDNGLRITHNPHADWAEPGTGEYQLPNGKVIASVQHHCSESSGSLHNDPSSGEEHSHSSNTTASSSPGTQSTQSTTVLSTFQPYPTSPTSPHGTSHPHVMSTPASPLNASQPHIISPTSPHNVSSQPLLSEDHCSQSPIKHSQSQDYSLQYGASRPPSIEGRANPYANQSQDCYATFPRQHHHPAHVHKTPSCSHLQSQGCSQRQSLSALPEDGVSEPSATSQQPQTKRSRSNNNMKRPDASEHLFPLPPPPPTPPVRRQSLEGIKHDCRPSDSVKSPVDREMRTKFAKEFLKLTPGYSGDSTKCIANGCDSPVPTEQRTRGHPSTGTDLNSGAVRTGAELPNQSSSVKAGSLQGNKQATSQLHNGVHKQLANGHAAFLSHDDNKQSPVVSL